MSKLYKVLLAVLVAGTISFNASAQDDYWSSRTDRSGIITHKAVARVAYPKEFKLFTLNIAPLRQQLFSIVGNQASRQTAVISLPNANGQIEQFEVYEASNFEPALQVQFPEIRAYSGKGINDPSAYLKLSISPQGIQTMVFRTNGPNEYIEPYSQDHTIYSVFTSQRNKGGLPWVCSTPDQQLAASLNTQVANRVESNAGQLKTMRLAQSCNGEYSNFFGATSSAQVALVLAAYNATLTRCNGTYEKDLAIHLNLVAQSTNVIYYNPATDPYTTLANWNTELQIALNTSLTGPATPLATNNAAYDIGHMFGASGGGGNAGCIGCVCVDGVASGTGATKGRGITSPADGIPMGDNFDIDYVAHEVGHQMGANHTFSFQLEGTGVNKEVGSGITIMGYAGITNQDVAPHSIDIFNMSSIDQIQVNMATKTCPITTSLAGINATPVVAPVSNYTIPITTPFALTGSATDADPGDVLTYCWEQNDNSTTTGNASVASPTKLTGPNWLSFSPTTNPVRTLPILATILAGNSTTPPLPGGDPIATIEALSSVARTLNFRLTVRDNRPYNGTAVGQTAFTDMTVTVNAATGPFLITTQNAPVTYIAGTTQTVSWSVNGTTGAPINCANVKISFSSDGGVTFPTVLAASTPNDGTHDIIIPATPTSAGRIKVEAIGNIFFDINNASITVTVPFGFTLSTPAPVSSTCPTPVTLTTNTTATYTGGHSADINLSASGVPAGTTVTFGTNPLTTSSTSTTINLNNANTLTPGTYNITIQGVSAGAPNQSVTATFTITPAVGPSITQQPVDQTVCVSTNASFSITSAAATSFQWQVSTNGGGSWSDIGGATASSYTIVGVTAGQNLYQYRCIASTSCGSTTSNAAILNVNSFATITGQPSSLTICEGAATSFNVVATTAIGTINYQWQVSTDAGATWNNLAGATTNTFAQASAPAAQNGYRFRCVLTTGCGTVNSASATLTVNTYPVFTLVDLPKEVCKSDLAFALSATLGGGTWSGTGVSGNTFTPSTAGLGVRQVTYTVNNAGCITAKSSPVTVDECPDRHRVLTNVDAIRIQANPNFGMFNIRLNSDLYTKLGIKVFGSDGRYYQTLEFNNLHFGSLIPMNLTSLAQGTYYLFIYNEESGFISRGDAVVIYKH